MMVYHAVDFDIDDFLSRIRGNKPPFACPAEACQKIYKSYAHMQKHMLIHRPPTPIEISVSSSGYPNSTITGGQSSELLVSSQSALNGISNHRLVNDRNMALSFPDIDGLVVFEPSEETQGQTFRCNIAVPLTFRIEDTTNIKLGIDFSCSKGAGDQCGFKPVSKLNNQSSNKKKLQLVTAVDNKPSDIKKSENQATEDNPANLSPDHNVSARLTVPTGVFEVDTEFSLKKSVELKEGSGYIRFIEKPADELDDVVEYDLDEEDLFWLTRINADRKQRSFSTVTESTLEWLMDRFEKEARFQLVSSNSGNSAGDVSALGQSGVDDDAVCAVCQDGTCENSNVILFCDVCNLAVHQECYGIPYVPEGPWLCRKCLHSPSEPVSCVLCPNRGGAFKKTADDRWAHVICGLWVPEVVFANLTFLEPLEGIDKIDPARWRLKCFICRQRNAGACIQCHKSSCYRAFHVTCAQHAGLYMKIEHTDDPGDAGIRKNAFCDQHCPPDHFKGSNKSMYAHSDTESPQSPEQAVRTQLRKARRFLADRRKSKPSICVPIVCKSKIDAICSDLSETCTDAQSFMRRAYAFWKLKREVRRGVPLLKRLQASSIHRNAANFAAAATTGDAESKRMRQQLQFWQQLRQDLERARLLAELIRKRERVKCDLFKLFMEEIELQIDPLRTFLLRLLEQLKVLDKQKFFAEPVGIDLAPDYHLIIKHPMDFSTMHEKICTSAYRSLESFREDFQLMLANCFLYNRRDSIYYAAATRLQEQSKNIFKNASVMLPPNIIYPTTDESLSDKPIESFDRTVDSRITEDPVKMGVESDEMKASPAVADEGIMRLKIYTRHRPIRYSCSEFPLAATRHSTKRKQLSDVETNDIQNSSPRLVRKRRRDFSDASTIDSHSPTGISLEQSSLKKTKLTPSRWFSGADRGSFRSGNLSRSPFMDDSKSSSLISRSYSSTSNWNGLSELTATHPKRPNLMLDGHQENVLSRVISVNVSHSQTPTREGPAFTRYRSTKARCEDEDESEDSDDEEEEESDDFINSTLTDASHIEPATSCVPSVTQSTLSSGVFGASLDRSIIATTTTVVGKSRMASASSRKLDRNNQRGRTHSHHNFSRVGNGSKSYPIRSGHWKNKSSTPSKSIIQKSTAELAQYLPNCSTEALENEKKRSLTLEPISTRSLLGDNKPTVSPLTISFSDSASRSESPFLSVTTSLEHYDSAQSDTVQSPGSKSTGRSSKSIVDRTSIDAVANNRFNPQDVVWAKCRGSPWYPALVIDPNAVDGFSHNGVHIPGPPKSVLDCGRLLSGEPGTTSDSSCTKQLSNLLVLFFDQRRTWQWLPPKYLQPLGIKEELDQDRLQEARRNKMKRSVRKAYCRAVEHLCKVHGRPYPYGDSVSGDLAPFSL